MGCLGLMVVCLVSCKKEVKEEPPVIRPVKTMVVGSAEDLANRTFPGITREAESVDLAFRVSGPLITFDVTEGQRVRKGELIAAIDPRDYENELSAREARYEQAKADKERFEAVYRKGSISKSEYELKLMQYREALSAFEAAKNALDDTELRVPFDAYIDKKFVENYERVYTGETIVTLFDLSSLEVDFTISEALAVHFREFADFAVTFDLFGDATFQADLKEIGKKSERSAGIPVTAILRQRKVPGSDEVIIPGMACSVRVNMQELKDEGISGETRYAVPVSAVYAEPESDQKFVFIVDPDSMVVRKTEVQLGALTSSSMIWALQGLESGDILVTAGAKVLQDGQKVKFLTQISGR